ncbi:hypothetical protein D9M71_624150 [compost metagenome]
MNNTRASATADCADAGIRTVQAIVSVKGVRDRRGGRYIRFTLQRLCSRRGGRERTKRGMHTTAIKQARRGGLSGELEAHHRGVLNAYANTCRMA